MVPCRYGSTYDLTENVLYDVLANNILATSSKKPAFLGQHTNSVCYQTDHALVTNLTCKQSPSVRRWADKEDELFWNKYKIVKSPGDGHCFIHSIVKSHNSQHSEASPIDARGLFESITTETTRNSSLYMSFIENESENDQFEQMKQYVRYKRYDSFLGDMMPLVVATILKKDIHILTTDDNGMEKTEIKSPGNVTCRNHIYVYKIGEHYDTVVPLIQTKPTIITGFCNEDMLSGSQTDFRSSLHWKTGGFLGYLKICCYCFCDDETDVTRLRGRTNLVAPHTGDANRVENNEFLQEVADFRTKSLITGHLDINGLRNKYIEIQYMLSQNTLDVLFLSETKIDQSFPKAQFI